MAKRQADSRRRCLFSLPPTAKRQVDSRCCWRFSLSPTAKRQADGRYHRRLYNWRLSADGWSLPSSPLSPTAGRRARRCSNSRRVFISLVDDDDNNREHAPLRDQRQCSSGSQRKSGSHKKLDIRNTLTRREERKRVRKFKVTFMFVSFLSIQVSFLLFFCE